ncbi:hypothetical protein ACFZAR_34820 [Streptomyces sp. NPDC008222]|uniref:hypothetical protein n=1 Tax=Streptomyces sp. NPDC008222 TaxID=3364820 RepID=UPI0036EC8D9F
MDSPALPIAKWLPGCAAWDRKRVSAEWDETGITLLRPAGKFFPISISLLIVEAAADTIGPTEVDTYLAEALHGAPFIRCNNGRWVYVLVEPVAARDWDVADAGCLGEETDLGVPCPDLVGAPRPYGVVLGGADGRAGRAGDEDDGDPARRLRPLQDGEAGGDAMTVAAQRTIDVTEVRKVYEAAFVRTSADGARSMRDQSEEPVRLLLLEVWAMRPVVEGAQDSLLEVVLRRAKEVLAEEPCAGHRGGRAPGPRLGYVQSRSADPDEVSESAHPDAPRTRRAHGESCPMVSRSQVAARPVVCATLLGLLLTSV